MAEIGNVPTYPWQPQSEIRGNLANREPSREPIADASHSARRACRNFVDCCGRARRFRSAACSVDCGGAETTRELRTVPQGSIVLVKTASGEEFLFGDWINMHLFREARSKFWLFVFVAASALQAGVDEKDLPDCNEIARHVAKSLGTPSFGVTRAQPGVQPQMQPYQLVKTLWPHVVNILRLPPPRNSNIAEPRSGPQALAGDSTDRRGEVRHRDERHVKRVYRRGACDGGRRHRVEVLSRANLPRNLEH